MECFRLLAKDGPVRSPFEVITFSADFATRLGDIPIRMGIQSKTGETLKLETRLGDIPIRMGIHSKPCETSKLDGLLAQESSNKICPCIFLRAES